MEISENYWQDKYAELKKISDQRRAGARKIDSLLKQINHNKWEKLAPDLLPQLLQNRETAEHSLGHSVASVRQAAIGVLADHWNATGEEAFRIKLEEMAFSDPDAEVRANALVHLSWAYHETDDVRIGILLATTVYNDTEHDECRWFAYQGLFKLRGIKTPRTSDNNKHMKVCPHIPGDIDWSFVDSFLVPDRIASPRDKFDIFPEKDREYWRSWHRGNQAYDLGAFEEAITHYTVALEGMPNGAGWLYKRAQTYIKLENWDAAIADLSRSIELVTGFAAPYNLRSEVYIKKGLIDLAEQDRQKAVYLGNRNEESRKSKRGRS